jgi:hypothetical protein
MAITRINVNQSNIGLDVERLLGDVLDGKLSRVQPTPAAKTVTTTLTAAEILTGLITGNQGGAAAASYTMPLGTALEAAFFAAFPALVNDDSYDFGVINISVVAAETITLVANTGVTLVGDMTLAAIAVGDESSGLFRLRRTAPNVFVVYRLS